MKKSIIAVLVLIGLIVYGAYDYLKKSPSETAQTVEPVTEELETGIQKGQLAPDFTLMDLEGNPVKLSDFKGKRVLLNFWATWCPPCRVEMPHMQKFYEDYESEDVVILGVNMTLTEENPDGVQNFVKDEQLTFPIVLDKEGDALQTYQVIAYPTTYLLDSTGVIREKFMGAINYEIMEKYVAEIE
ncbi:TlpA family protein disulfide reductase [Paenibacillus oralis]|uniref:TlpA family protein disulfide reductase n=1 Tax=Paenibacillus oralis TaxID=2490856 RepID=A0A3P3U6F3_9BACL|nr:TlpA family protein disulfide reductase [Paenibacillus oralis]RRJ65139.1 TlpA family protein disulfide reductase [Paenibacillus oralis]